MIIWNCWCWCLILQQSSWWESLKDIDKSMVLIMITIDAIRIDEHQDKLITSGIDGIIFDLIIWSWHWWEIMEDVDKEYSELMIMNRLDLKQLLLNLNFDLTWKHCWGWWGIKRIDDDDYYLELDKHNW